MTAPTELIHKLQIKSGAKLWLINVPRELVEELAAGAEVEIVHENDAYDGVVAFFESAAEVPLLVPRILKELPPDGLLWVGYRKGPEAKAAGLNRDTGWEALDAADWRPVRQVAITEEWSGLRFRPRNLVKAKDGSQFA
ncbi:hypothetical protein SAMN06295905_1102 [Devosia lucknowensis]|uniref:DUF3052 domain-containing protein n=1 Tax=Devosia lucknowensis TaxID=1096929 RepID=A0A1Y6EQK5_9HYPH|nr:hypothetical protein [Devosia lucknowensis]SMQ64954.1 hypothetical protein SAMN06295905_1102 [Devosia lucknowensis]